MGRFGPPLAARASGAVEGRRRVLFGDLVGDPVPALDLNLAEVDEADLGEIGPSLVL